MNTTSSLIESGDPAADTRAFRRCLGQFATGVTVMTTRHGEQLAGMSVNSFAALSLEPPLVLWSIRRQSASLSVFQAAGHFAVNVLGTDQVDISNRFSSPGTDKFALSTWSLGRLGAPLLEGCIAHLECQVEQMIEGGDHLIVVGRVAHYARYQGDPLIFMQGRYAVTEEHPDAVASAATAAPQQTTASDVAAGSLLRLLHFSSHQMSSKFEAHREAEGLTVAQFRVYSWLRTQPRTLTQLRQLSYLGGRDADDAVQELFDRGHVTRDASGALNLTAAGRVRADAIAPRVQSFERALLQGIPEADVAITRRVLDTLAQRALHA